MAGVITTGSSPKALWPGVQAWWGRRYNEWQDAWKPLFDQGTSDKAYEEDVQITGFGLAPRKTEGNSVYFDSETQGFTTRYTNVVYGLGYIVTQEEVDDCLYEEVSKRRVDALHFSMRQTKEVVCANVYNRGFNTSYVGGDGVSLFNTAHPTLAGSQANRPTVDADLSESSLEDLMILIMNATNDRGLRVHVMARSLHVAPNEVFNASRILKSVYQPGTANNDINVIKGENWLPGGVHMNPYFSQPHAWFVRTNIPNGMKYLERRALAFADDNDFDTGNLKYKADMRFSVGWSDWRGAYGVNGP